MSNEIRIIRTLDAPAERVAETWLAPTTLVPPVTRVEMDAVVGGPIRISTGAAESDDLAGTFVRVDLPHRVTYTWRWGSDGDETLVDVRFHAAGDATVVEVRHDGFSSDDDRERHRAGWQAYLDGVATYL